MSNVEGEKMMSQTHETEEKNPPNPPPMTAEPILQFFAYDHLRQDLKDVSFHFAELAQKVVDMLPRNPERTVALRKLLEAKDAAVRARLFK